MKNLSKWAFVFSAAVMLVAGLGFGLQPDANSASAKESTENRRLDENAKGEVEAWAKAVASGNVDTVRQRLAPEFQILRSDGKGYDEAEYLAGGLPKIDSIISVQDVVATEHGNLMVVRYVLSLDATVDGKVVQRRAPRLTVFRRDGDRWLVVAHANFAHLQK
ncbi:MAG: nuclear transport factor 2 family protein [Xanthobacteraceae bacterium]